MSVRIPGRIDVTRSKDKYHHEAEHRGHGIVAIYSYGPAGEHDALVRESKRVMTARFGVTAAVGSGGCSGYPEDGTQNDRDWRNHTMETQTIFCIHAVSGRNRPKLRTVAPASADWHLAYLVDTGQEYLGDGEVHEYFSGPLEDEEVWREKVREMTGGEGRIVEALVRAVPQGAYWFLSDGDPIADWKD